MSIVFLATTLVSFVIIIMTIEAINMPHRGFLEQDRWATLLDLKRNSDDTWSVISQSIGDEAAVSAPADGVRVVIREDSMGRWDTVGLRAWRVRRWSVLGFLDSHDQWVDPDSGDTPFPSPTDLAALQHMIEDRVIKTSRLFDLWPPSGTHTAERTGPLRWSNGSEGTSASTLTIYSVMAVGCGVALTLLNEYRRRQRFTRAVDAPPSPS